MPVPKQKTQRHLILAALLLSGLIISSAFARAPAVLPVTELSIEEYNQIGPDEAKSPGYDFSSKGTAQVLVPVQNNVAQQNHAPMTEGMIMTRAIEKHAMMSLRSISTYLILFMISLPVLAWLYMSKRPQHNQWTQAPEQNRQVDTFANDLSNVTSLPKRQANLDKEDDVKKAS